MRVAVARIQHERLCQVMCGPGVQHDAHRHCATGSGGGGCPESPRSISRRRQCAEGLFRGEARVPVVIPTDSTDMEFDGRRRRRVLVRIMMRMTRGGREGWLSRCSDADDQQQRRRNPKTAESRGSDESLEECLLACGIPLSTLNQEEMIIYKLVQHFGSAGVDSRELKNKSKINANQVNKLLKKLDKNGMIKSYRLKNKKMWVHYDVEPDVVAKAGAFFREEEVDGQLVGLFSANVL